MVQIDAQRIPNATTCRNGPLWAPRCSLPDTPYRLMPRSPISASPGLAHLSASRHRRPRFDAFERVPAASTPWGMARYRQRQPPARFAPITERDHYQTGMAPALPGRTGEFGSGKPNRTAVSRLMRPGVEPTLHPAAKLNWLRRTDSNRDRRLWRPQSYHWTTPK